MKLSHFTRDKAFTVNVFPHDVFKFNKSWPCSNLKAVRYFFVFNSQSGDLVDTGVPDGEAGAVLSQDAFQFAAQFCDTMNKRKETWR